MQYYIDNDGQYLPYKSRACRSASWFVILGFVIFGISLFAAFKTNDYLISQTTMQTEYLCTVTRPCNLTLTVKFDNEPVDVLLCAPDGTWYAPYSVDYYNLADNTMTMSLETTTLGDWELQYNRLGNFDIQITTEQLPVDRLMIPEVKIDSQQKDFVVSFTPFFGDGSDISTLLQVDITMHSLKSPDPITIYSGQIELNTPVAIQCNMTDMYRAADWTMTVKITNADRPNDTAYIFDYQAENVQYLIK